jgi:hypothetical protein
MDWMIAFIDTLCTSRGTTSNYSTTADLHTSQFTTAPNKPFPSAVSTAVSWQRLLTVEILQLPALGSFPGRLSFRTAWQLFPQLKWIAISSQPPLQSSTALSTSLHDLTRVESESYVTTDGQSASLSWNKAPIWGLRPDFLFLSDSCGFVDVGRSL